MRKKLLRFQENSANPRFLESGKDSFEQVKGRWNEIFFSSGKSLALELGCGTGRYVIGLAKKKPTSNFVGVDIKGARMWVAAQQAQAEGFQNVGFLRTRIELLDRFFAKEEVDEIYITFPDPRPKESEAKKRLTSERFLQLYQEILKPGGQVHLKTDNEGLYLFTLELVQRMGLPIFLSTEDLYGEHPNSFHTQIQTTYEERFLREGAKIKSLIFGF